MEENKYNKEEEIDLIELINTVWNGRKIIFKSLLIFGSIGLFIAIFSPKEYTASTIIIPSSFESVGGSGKLGGLAAIKGINIGNKSSEVIPVNLYPKVVGSIPFLTELVKTSINVAGRDEKIDLLTYYREVYSPGVLAWIRKYTIGLPGLIRGLFTRSKQVDIGENKDYGVLFMTPKEQQMYSLVKGKIVLEVNEREGYITLSAKMPEPIAAAQLAQKAQELLQRYIIEIKSKKAQEQLAFIKERYEEKKEEFEKAERALTLFQDKNKNITLATAAIQEKRLQAEYNLTYGVYSGLAKEIEKQKIQVKEDTPVFTVIEPVSIPSQTSKPRRVLILAIWLFLGVVVGGGIVLGKYFIENLKKREEK